MTSTGNEVTFLLFEKKYALLGLPDNLCIFLKIPKAFRTLNPFGDNEMPAPYSLISFDFSKITTGIFAFFKKQPKASPDIPAPIIPMWPEKSFIK